MTPVAEKQRLSHVDEEGRVRMVDVSHKSESAREAVARGRVRVSEETLRLLKEAALPKGDVLTVAQVAGIMAAKRTWELIPMCHPLPLAGIDVRLWLTDDPPAVEIEASVRTKAATGVEMEALTAASAAALTVYDMAKAVQRDMVIEQIYLVSKKGGARGDYRHPGRGDHSPNPG